MISKSRVGVRYRMFTLLATLGLLLSMTLAACGDNTATPVPATTTAAATTSAATTAATTASGATSAAATTAAATGKFDGVIKFGAPLSLTGSLNNESKQTQNGYELWKEAVNNAGGIKIAGKAYSIDITYYDDESKQDKSAQLAEKLIKEDKVNFLLGPYGTNSTKTVSAIAEQYKIPMVEGNGAAESIFSQGYKYTFGVLSPSSNYLAGVVDALAAQSPKPKTVAILSANDNFSVEVADAAKKVAEKNGFQVVVYEKYPNAETNLTSQVAKVKDSNAEILLNSGHLNEAIAVVKAAKELKYSPVAMGFSVGPGLPEFADNLKADANYVLGGSQWTSAVKYKGTDIFASSQKYYDDYKKKFGVEPAYQAADGTACGLAFQYALEKAGTLDPTKVRDTLAGLDIMTFYGQIKFDDRGANIYKPMVVEQWQSGKKVTVWPNDVAETKMLFPTPAWDKRS
ncbi:MAG: amino acid ABC transporter substrate-binding protein [Chloroflexi bacterium]|uniref:Amino acid ABC transporter substrate-binding protein n=1 Tax=Candidatus Chlorohelix allophototropha TaxID=3003348 RepID=A0A8T7MAJ3_9CHLR|nr:amino acid ABC transporter substrate-binding protein [Chloroflexota bacterium]WJW68974.1 amino acid ABC transporter substrate-binding protein [Chloroflexota bacterium L227-S17]